MIDFKLNALLLEKLEVAASSFVGTVIDISQGLSEFSADLNVDVARKLGVTQGQLSVQAVEEYIRKIAAKAGIEVVCLVKDQVGQDLIDNLRFGRIIVLK
ncbi:MAG TPA: hypothetical protein VKF36_07350 [Syntrophorhabdales bacterium]|nr:hypothetical protein [Syntrophorhabdales bacterium]